MNLITFTGADERTNLPDLIYLASNPFVEIGLLYTANPGGRNRYPSMDWLLNTAAGIKNAGGRVAIHVCGMKAREQLLAGELENLVSCAHRVQVNGMLSAEEARAAAALVPALITQRNERNAALANLTLDNHAVLVDDSGGRGISPLFWEAPSVPAWKPFGFAGGLGPQNLSVELPKIREAAGHGVVRSWIDMEGKLRDENDWFDIERAKQCANIFRQTFEHDLVNLLRIISRTTLHPTMPDSFRAREQFAVSAAASLIEKNHDAVALREGLVRIKQRLHFMGWPAEDHWNIGTGDKPRWTPDWRYEIQLIEHLLHGSPITTPDKPGDTIPANQLPQENWSLEQITQACQAAGMASPQIEQILTELQSPSPASRSRRERGHR